MKKTLSVIFIFLAFVFGVGYVLNSNNISKPTFAFADGNIESTDFNFRSKESLLMDYNSKTVIYKANELERRPIASMCKIMTLLLCFEEIDKGNLSFDEEITVSENASGMGGSQIFLETNGQYKVKELIKGITVASANDACVAMAERICGSEENFVSKMNEKAALLSMNNTKFVNCTGLPKIGQYSCALDVSKMFSELINHKEYFEFSTVWMDEIKHPKDRKTEISNTNKLIKFYNGCDGGKTGYTSEAGHCLCATATRNGVRLIAVVISSPDSKTRFNEVSNMFNYGFNNFENKLVIDENRPINLNCKVENGKTDIINGYVDKPYYTFSKKGENIKVDTKFIPNEKICAPLYKGNKIGELEIYENGKLKTTLNVIIKEDIEKKVYFDYLYDVIENWGII